MAWTSRCYFGGSKKSLLNPGLNENALSWLAHGRVYHVCTIVDRLWLVKSFVFLYGRSMYRDKARRFHLALPICIYPPKIDDQP
jgi:ribose 1,5-bisphosphokinase PhnN